MDLQCPKCGRVGTAPQRGARLGPLSASAAGRQRVPLTVPMVRALESLVVEDSGRGSYEVIQNPVVDLFLLKIGMNFIFCSLG